jgi:catechol 2,3-dioxygenase-like lactoylglutathione lyase family enzyme
VSSAFRASRDVIIRTQNFAEAARFYGEVLGLPVAYHDDNLIGFDAGSFRLYVEPGPAHGPVFDFLVPDVAASKAALLMAGCSMVEENPAVPRCYLRDPHGLVFNLAQRPAE